MRKKYMLVHVNTAVRAVLLYLGTSIRGTQDINIDNMPTSIAMLQQPMASQLKRRVIKKLNSSGQPSPTSSRNVVLLMMSMP